VWHNIIGRLAFEAPASFMSPDKEPMFFNTDFGNQKTKSFPAYESLYKDARAEHFAVGEASTFYPGFIE